MERLLRGVISVDLRLSPKKTAATSVEDLRNIIANGKGRMPKYAGKLTPEEIDNFVQQIRGLNGK